MKNLHHDRLTNIQFAYRDCCPLCCSAITTSRQCQSKTDVYLCVCVGTGPPCSPDIVWALIALCAGDHWFIWRHLPPTCLHTFSRSCRVTILECQRSFSLYSFQNIMNNVSLHIGECPKVEQLVPTVSNLSHTGASVTRYINQMGKSRAGLHHWYRIVTIRQWLQNFCYTLLFVSVFFLDISFTKSLETICWIIGLDWLILIRNAYIL